MASISLQAPIHASQFMSGPPSPSHGVPAHARRKSRNPAAAPLPSFTFNPGAADDGVEAESPVDEAASAMKISSRRAPRPPTLPDFKFNPGADLPVDERPSPTHPVLEAMALNQQRIARSARPSPLPSFTFTPGHSSQATPSPTRSEFNETYLGRPVAGHKRAGSEFVGGVGTDAPTLISTSPQKHESRPSGPPLAGTGRRGHIHRRSQAISISDIDTSDLIKVHAIAKARRESEPPSGTVTPTETPSTVMSSQGSPPQRQSIPTRSPPSSPQRRESTPGMRPRVEFADKIDVIPRPLSMISSEGSASTVRYSHSLTSSINSIASPTRKTSITSTLHEDFPQQRPKTADSGALLLSAASFRRHAENEVSLPTRPLSACGIRSTSEPENQPPKKKHFWFSHSPDRTPLSTPKSERSDPLASLPEFAPSKSSNNVRPKTSPERSASLKRRKYHTWTGGLFQKKSKHRLPKSKARRSPTPAEPHRRVSDQVNEIFDADDTIVLRTGSPELKRTQPRLDTNIVPVQFTPGHDVYEVVSPVLDLDAALGVSGSEESLSAEAQSRSAASRIARLHSSERRGVVDAFGVVHRRTESAPSMPAFNRNGFGIARHASNPSLAEDVFDEEEEDNFLANQKTPQKVSGTIRKNASEQHDTTPQTESLASPDGLGLTNVSNISDEVVIVDAEEDIGGDDQRSSRSTLEPPTYLEADVPKRPMSSPMSFAYPCTQSHYASSTEGRTTTTASIISSPDPEHGLYDTAKLTPTLSQHSPDFYLRPSNDDLPSLSDSVSSSAIPRVSSSANTRSSIDQLREQRSASMFVPGTSRSNQSWKRSSLASLNRLIPGSANGSRLKFETTPESQAEDKSKRRSNRLSRFVAFWRVKDRDDGI